MTDQELEELRLGFLLLAEVVRVHLEDDARDRGIDTINHGPCVTAYG